MLLPSPYFQIIQTPGTEEGPTEPGGTTAAGPQLLEHSPESIRTPLSPAKSDGSDREFKNYKNKEEILTPANPEDRPLPRLR